MVPRPLRPAPPETPPELLVRRRHATAPPPRPCTGEHGHAHHTGPGQRGHGWGQPARSPLSPIPEQFPSSSGRSPRRRLHARILSPAGRLEPSRQRRGRNVLDPTEGSVHRVPEKFPVLAVKVRALACLCAGEDVRPPNSTRAACWHPGWPRARPPRRRPLRVTTLARSRARRVLRGRRPVRTGRPPVPFTGYGPPRLHAIWAETIPGVVPVPTWSPALGARLHVFSTRLGDCPRPTPGTRRGANVESGGTEWGPAALNIEQTTADVSAIHRLAASRLRARRLSRHRQPARTPSGDPREGRRHGQ
jgi:hypothetical protein